MILTGAGQIGMAIARRMGYGMKIVVGDKRIENAQAVADTMNRAGFDVLPEQRRSEQAYRVRTVLSRVLPFLSGLPVELLGHLLKFFPVHFPIPCVSISA